MQKHSVSYQHSTINYYSFGTGKELLIALHGYGETGESFAVLEKYLGNEYTIIALDFPFHGATDWNDGLLFTADALIAILHLINPSTKQPFTLLGYSMGGRVSLYLLHQYPQLIKKIILIAPDGLHHNFWHWFSTQTFIGNRLFAFTMHHPKWLYFLMKAAVAVRLFNKSIFNFVQYYLHEKSSRLILYKRWTAMRKFSPNLPLLKKIIPQNEISIKILFGKYDKIIVTKRGLQFQQGIEKWVTVKELVAGHQLLKEKYAAEIAALCTA